MNFTFYQLVIRNGRALFTRYITIYPDMVEIHRHV